MVIDVSISLSNAFNPKLPSCVANLGHDELVLIEMQGTLDIECNEDTSTRDAQFVGKLNLTNANKPTLIIGHHLLDGKVVTLPKPLGVMHRKETSKRYDCPGDEDSSRSAEDTSNPGVSWGIVAVVKKKIVFSKRPMPIVNLGGSTQKGKV
ncbi:Ctf8-domain-containing protein [Suillus clintonianus]|uniref:Ctf8-domain-containing protein n=1 Tax=Suillus clintonianus TaxID=1904413 RepID=UPI001B878D27|nr:Ctf8-domain-containing protein [Suillus clintonianus]KAG2122783.1 Ctf8-domain-containing protein [Suillus clintonianus]